MRRRTICRAGASTVMAKLWTLRSFPAMMFRNMFDELLPKRATMSNQRVAPWPSCSCHENPPNFHWQGRLLGATAASMAENISLVVNHLTHFSLGFFHAMFPICSRSTDSSKLRLQSQTKTACRRVLMRSSRPMRPHSDPTILVDWPTRWPSMRPLRVYFAC